MYTELIKTVIEFLKQKWYSPFSLVLLSLLIVTTGLFFITNIDFDKLSATKIVIIIIIVILSCTVWFLTTRIPKTPSQKYGFLIAISTDKEEYRQKIKNDLIETLKELLKERQGIYQYNFIELPEYHARKIKDHDSALKYLMKTNSQFVLFGRARQRNIKGKSHHIFNLHGIVRHRQIPIDVSNKLRREFREVIPRDVKFPAEDDLLNLEFSAEWITIGAQYIVAIAMLLSLNFAYAEQLFSSLLKDWKPEYDCFPALRTIHKRLPLRLSEVHASSASAFYKEWKNSKKPELLTFMKNHLDKLKQVDSTSYAGHLLRAIWLFISDRRVNEAITEIRQCKDYNMRDVSWRYSYAFLLAYRGETQQALKQYQIAERGTIGSNTPVEIENFLLWILHEEPEKVEIHFCLGMVNYIAKYDMVLALEEFEAFLDNTKADTKKHKIAREYAIACVRKIQVRLEAM